MRCWREHKLVQPDEKQRLLPDPVISLLGIYPKEKKSQSGRDICSPVVTAALLTNAKTRKQPKCPLMDEWTKCGI